MRIELQDVHITSYQVGGASESDDDYFDFGLAQASAPSTSEFVITKLSDGSTPPFFPNGDTPIDRPIFDDGSDPGADGSILPYKDPSADGSILPYNPYVTVDYLDA